MDVCTRCSREILVSEVAHLVDDRVVCPNCKTALTRPPPLPVTPLLHRKIDAGKVAAVSLAALVVLGAIFGAAHESSDGKPAGAARPPIGANGEAVIDAGGMIAVGRTQDAQAQVTRAAARGQRDEIMALVREGRAFMLPNGTRVRVIDGGVFSSEIRVTEGGHAGSIGFLNNELMRGP